MEGDRIPASVVSANLRSIESRAFDLIVIGGTPGGIAAAVRASREGLSVLLVQHNRHLGGMLTNGLMQWDALYGGYRAPIFNEVANSIAEYYRETFGVDSDQYKVAKFTQSHYPMSRFEPKVAEHILTSLVSSEPGIILLLETIPVGVQIQNSQITTLSLAPYAGGESIHVSAKVFIDATYEADLAALARVPYRVGREGYEEFHEPHAGKIFTNIRRDKGPRDALDGTLNLHPYSHVQGSVDPASPRTADNEVQAYNFRFCLTNDPLICTPPPVPTNYNRGEYLDFYRKGMGAGRINGKATFNSPILPGEGKAYPEAGWIEREHIAARHRDFALGLMYFLQNDDSVSPEQRAIYQTIGLPSDEFADNGHIPYEMYVREARRIVGRQVFTELDNMRSPRHGRAPIQSESIGITDWSMDSHDCTMDRRDGYAFDGKLILTEESRPAQIPWSCLISDQLENLVVPVCMSATHVAWGAVRLEPVFMQIGEAAGLAAALCIRGNTNPVGLDVTHLQRELVKRRFALTFFNDIDAADPDPRVQAAQFWGTKGFFPFYDAQLDEPVRAETEQIWRAASAECQAGVLQPEDLAARLYETENASPPSGGLARGELLVALYREVGA